MNRFELTLDLDKRGGVAQWVTLRQGDRRGTELRATIYDHGVQVGSGYTCRVVIRRPDVAEYYRETCEYSLGVATVTIDEQYAAAISGSTYGYFELLQGGSVIASTESFGVRILPDATADATVGPEYDSAIDDALAELDEATGRITQMVIDATEEYLEAHPELTTTVEDNSLTDAKLIQHGGILDRVARLWHRLDNLLTSTPAEADLLTVSDAAKTPLAGLALYGRSTQDGTPTPSAPVAIQSVTPNLLDVNTLLAHGIGTTYTIGADGRVTVNANDSNGWASQATIDLPLGTYTIMREVNRARLQLPLYDVGSTTPRQTISLEANGVFSQTFTVTVPTQARLKVGNSSDASNYPFTTGVALYAGSVVYPFVPYQNVGLWARGKNLLPPNVLTSASGFYADGGNGAINVTASDNRLWTVIQSFPLSAGTYTFHRSDASGRVTINIYDADGNVLTQQNLQNGESTLTFTALANTSYAKIKVGYGASSYPFTTTVQLELGSTATTYVPYAESTTPIPLQGHALRSLPDGTRDEVTVDQYGHATLIQRVGSYTVTGEEQTVNSTALGSFYRVGLRYTPNDAPSVANATSGWCSHAPFEMSYSGQFVHSYTNGTTSYIYAQESTLEAALAAFVGAEIQYPLATPVTIDLGTVDPVAMQGPDMTAQAVPTAPFALTYERDLNITLARLEAAIAELATN